jgi:hypothetical protein
LFAKKSKYSFGEREVEYLGYIISLERVAANSNKIEAVRNWHKLQSDKELRGFIGLSCYYREFIGNFGVINKPLTNQLKKKIFNWNEKS